LSRPADHYLEDAQNSAREKYSVTDFSSLSNPEIADRIAILRDNIRQLTEQAAAQSGAANEERTAERIAVQNEELESLVKEQERRARK
jgi:uncharacterized small protein (DUF1192 family)